VTKKLHQHDCPVADCGTDFLPMNGDEVDSSFCKIGIPCVAVTVALDGECAPFDGFYLKYLLLPSSLDSNPKHIAHGSRRAACYVTAG